MAIQIDCGFSHAIARAVLEDSPDNQFALEILKKAPFRVNGREFKTKDEMLEYLNGREFEQVVTGYAREVTGCQN